VTGPRVVICTAAVGCGHTRAALALRVALRRLAPQSIVQVIEALDHAPAWFVRGYRDAYLATIACAPRLAGWLYERMDKPPRGLRSGGLLERRALRRFMSAPQFAKADLVVTTHFLCARLLSDLRAQGARQSLRAPLAVCVTDRHPHGMWLVPNADQIFVASDSARLAAQNAGIARERLIVSGIPVDPAFGTFKDKLAVRRALRLPTDRPIALLCGGGLGLGNIEATLRALLSTPGPSHIVVVCGRNEQLRARLAPLERRSGSAPTCQVIGFTMRMPQLMGAADVLIGKPGGLTTAEAAASALPMVLLEPLPGQEERNAQELIAQGAAIPTTSPVDAGRAAAVLMADTGRLGLMRRAAGVAAPQFAAERAAAAMLSSIGWALPAIGADEGDPTTASEGVQMAAH
jgi:processive 1,2-diacylglycerol beta-glucosyltransferase